MSAQMPENDRSDSVKIKLGLLQAAHAAGNHDLAMSLAESIKDTLSMHRQWARDPAEQLSDAEHFLPVEQLPRAWAAWSRGWLFCKRIALFETVGVARRREPVDVLLGFRGDQVDDPVRELRVARVNGQTGALDEVTSQVYDQRREGDQQFCRVVFQANVAMHDRADYLLFYGNKNAELPRYSTDLRVRGEGVGLDIENQHFTANLSRQMGQLERLTYKREHGLELYAGGKGHGEPPGIDWAHDYVDPGHFQKLRTRCWGQCPNYEVVRGPLCIRVRRWGFPHSPIHPVFTPSRMHMDQTYVFHAGLPYFVKEARFDMIQDFEISAMRDDEWVFSGYSFTDQVWIDQQGKLHEGKPTAEQADLGRWVLSRKESGRLHRALAGPRLHRSRFSQTQWIALAPLRGARATLGSLPSAATSDGSGIFHSTAECLPDRTLPRATCGGRNRKPAARIAQPLARAQRRLA